MSKKYIVLIILVILVVIFGRMYFAYKDTFETLGNLSDAVGSIPVIDSGDRSVVKTENVCNLVKDDMKKSVLEASSPVDGATTYPLVQSATVASAEMMKARNEYIQSLSTAEQAAHISDILVYNLPVSTGLSSSLLPLVFIESCSVLGSGGEMACFNGVMDMGGDFMKRENSITNNTSYDRVVSEGLSKEGPWTKKMELSGILGDPSDIKVTSYDEGKIANYTWSRDLSGTETHTATSEGLSYTMTEDKSCNGSMSIASVRNDGLEVSVEMQWTFSGGKTSGTLVSTGNQDFVNTNFAW